MDLNISRPWLKSLSGLFINLSATWIAITFITPNFIKASLFEVIFLVLKNIGFAIILLLVSIELEKNLEI